MWREDLTAFNDGWQKLKVVNAGGSSKGIVHTGAKKIIKKSVTVTKA